MAELKLKPFADKLGISESQLVRELEEKFKIKIDTKVSLSGDLKKQLIEFIQFKKNSAVTLQYKSNQKIGGKKKINVEIKKSKTFIKKDKTKENLTATVKKIIPSAPPQNLTRKVEELKKVVLVESKKTEEVKANKTAKIERNKRFDSLSKVKPKNKVLTQTEKLAAELSKNLKKKRTVVITTEDRLNNDKYGKNILNFAKINTREAEIDVAPETSVTTNKLKAKIKPLSKHTFKVPTKNKKLQVEVGDHIEINELAKKLNLKSKAIVKKLSQIGVEIDFDSAVDFDTAYLLIEELGHKAVHLSENSLESLIVQQMDVSSEVSKRIPVVTIMGHVDHGKTTLLDTIRSSSVADKEAGGITQHLSAYHVKTKQGVITFVDTPGHAAFTAMRARGSKFTDIVVLIIAGDDGVMPQTIEIIQHVKAAEVPILVAVNKMDRPDVSIEKIIQQLAQHDVLAESWGGEVPVLPISAISGQGIEQLLEMILLQAEILELTARTEGDAEGVVLECRVEKGRGTVTNLLVQNGTLKQGDVIVSGVEFGKVKGIEDCSGKRLKNVGPAIPVELLGFTGLPQSGNSFQVVKTEKIAREVCEYRKVKNAEQTVEKNRVSLDDIFANQEDSNKKDLNLIIKADTNGSCEAITDSLQKLSNDKLTVKIVSQGVGGIKESDVTLAIAHEAIIIGFNVRADNTAKSIIRNESIDVHYYSIIYQVVDQVKQAILGRLDPEFKENIIGLAEVRDVFHAPKMGAIAGCMVSEGEVKRNSPIRVLRNDVVIYEGELESLRRFKDDVSSVSKNTECGIGVKNYNDVKTGDRIEVFERIEIKPTL